MNLHSTVQNSDKTESDTKRQWLLAQGIKSLLKCDEAETVQGIARYVIAQYPSLRIGSEFVERKRKTLIPSAAAFLGAVTRFLEVRDVQSKSGAVWVARLDNERRAIKKLLLLLPELNWTEIILHRKPDRAAVFALPHRIFPLKRRIFKLVRLLLRGEHEFFKVLRVVEMIGYYAGYLKIFRQSDFRLAIMSSHSNPHGIAFNLAARRCGIPTVLITHGMPVRPVAKLSYDLAVVHCEAARQTYLEEGCRFKQTLIHGQRQNYISMPEILPNKDLTIGIFLCKDVNEIRLREVIERLLRNKNVSRIIIRPHPKNLFVKFDEWLETLDEARVQRSFNQSVFQDLEKSDIVLGGNSSVLIEAVTAGRPACYIDNLDYGSTDLHQLVACRLVYVWDADSDFDFDEMLDFYRRKDWIDVLRIFADIDNDESAAAERIAAAVRQLIEKRAEC